MSKRFIVSGSKHNDILKGTDRADVLFGKKGNDKLFGLDGRDFLFGGKGDDKLFGGDGDDFLFGGKGSDRLFGGEGNDFLFGGKGNDRLFGGEGNDKLFAGKGDDYLDGGAGSDYLFGDKGNDTFNFNWSENLGEENCYDGGKGLDTLKLTLTTGELKLAQQEIDEFEALLENGGNAFHFDNFGLTVRNFERVIVNEVNTAPTALNDSAMTGEDAPIVIDVLGNDSDPDRLDVLTVSADATSKFGAAIVVKADGSISYDPREAAALQALGDGDTEIDSFSYTIKDLAGATSTATVNVEVTGVDDGPTPTTIRVAIVGVSTALNQLVANQLTDNTQGFDFDTTATIDFSSDFTANPFVVGGVRNFEVVVIGENGDGTVAMDNPSLFAALNAFITAGGGVVTTGAFAGFHLEGAGAETISPVKNPDAGGVRFTGLDPTITVADGAADHFIWGDIAGNSYTGGGFYEIAFNGVDDPTMTTTKVLATLPGGVAIAYDASQSGRTVYLASLQMHDTAGDASREFGSTVDAIFERAVAWASGVGDADPLLV